MLFRSTYTKNLAEDIKDNLRKICTAEEMKRIDIINLDAWVSNFLRRQGYEYHLISVQTGKLWINLRQGRKGPAGLFRMGISLSRENGAVEKSQGLMT